MGHPVPVLVHNAIYSQWSPESILLSSMKRTIKNRDLTNGHQEMMKISFLDVYFTKTKK